MAVFEQDALRADVEAALAAGGGAAAMAVLVPYQAELQQHAWFAQLWCVVLQHTPARETLVDEASKVLERFGTELEVAVAGLAALNAAAALWPPDAPRRQGGPEDLVVAHGTRILENAGAHPLRAYVHVNLANALRLQGEEADEGAQTHLNAALELEPERGGWHHDLATLHMWRGRWTAALDCMLRARARLGETRGIVWNLALISTALGDGDVAAGAWRDLGFDGVRLGKGGLPLFDGLPATQVRVRSRASGHGVEPEPEDRFEVLTVAPHSPGHGVVVTPSFGDSPIDYGDLILWAPTPVARAASQPIYPVLEKLHQGDESRHRFVALARPGEIDALVQRLPDGCYAFVRGDVADEAERLVYGKLVAPGSVTPDVLRERLDHATAALRTLRFAIPDLYEVSGDSRRAGQEHQAWRGVERAAIKRGLVAGHE